MDWNLRYPKEEMPNLEQIDTFIANPLWNELCRHVELTYAAQPRIEHSRCSGAPGWNVKYKKSGRSLCTLYPRDGYFTCLIAISGTAATEAELSMERFSPAMRDLYRKVQPCNGSRWFMIDVKTRETLTDLQGLIALRAAAKR